MALKPSDVYKEIIDHETQVGADFIEKRIDEVLQSVSGYQNATPNSCISIAKSKIMARMQCRQNAFAQVLAEVKQRYESAGWRMEVEPHIVTLYPIARGGG